jgi:hypothetical protein
MKKKEDLVGSLEAWFFDERRTSAGGSHFVSVKHKVVFVSPPLFLSSGSPGVGCALTLHDAVPCPTSGILFLQVSVTMIIIIAQTLVRNCWTTHTGGGLRALLPPGF